MKKIAIASAAMGGAALIAFGASGTFAAFSDTAEPITNSARAGSVVLDASSPSAAGSAEAVQIQPNGKATYAYWIQNDGSLNGNLTTQLSVVDEENGCVGPEVDWDTTCEDDEPGEFSLFAQVRAGLAGTDEDACTAEAMPAAWQAGPMKLNAAPASPWLAPRALPAGQGACVVVEISLPDDPNINLAQSDSVNMTATFTLNQVTTR